MIFIQEKKIKQEDLKKARFLSRVSKKKKIHESDEGEFFGRIEEKQKANPWMKQLHTGCHGQVFSTLESENAATFRERSAKCCLTDLQACCQIRVRNAAKSFPLDGKRLQMMIMMI